jgi:hypothetical protein
MTSAREEAPYPGAARPAAARCSAPRRRRRRRQPPRGNLARAGVSRCARVRARAWVRACVRALTHLRRTTTSLLRKSSSRMSSVWIAPISAAFRTSAHGNNQAVTTMALLAVVVVVAAGSKGRRGGRQASSVCVVGGAWGRCCLRCAPHGWGRSTPGLDPQPSCG